MINEVIRLLNVTYGNKKVQSVNKVYDYYNDGLYKKVKNKTVTVKQYEILNTRNQKNNNMEVKLKDNKVFPRDLINKRFKLLDVQSQKVVDLKVDNDEKENYEKGIINTTSPLVYCLVNKEINDIVLVSSMDKRKNLITEYKILEIN